ncbi:MAG: hypothetical protein F6K22_18050 [Okeania sp. SIO2F4]|uniref:hypothetical protein n=1 Tax=Okeania sp. SIO2F4 TaxID=2607790 RepID=UPI00142CD388|nr:hypothetical protein [Okeania sp. SIO2F4]MDJ0518942.1 hypothetical protein [Trichodesmium sp. MO_231.B1]NES04564.1 hypothetical protein [Okeania sp. SIO2F4]
MSLGKDLFKAYTKPIKRKDLFKALNKSSQAISEISIAAFKQSENIRLNKKTQKKIIEGNLNSVKWLGSLFIRE